MVIFAANIGKRGRIKKQKAVLIFLKIKSLDEPLGDYDQGR
jgi:hypothetical protein